MCLYITKELFKFLCKLIRYCFFIHTCVLLLFNELNQIVNIHIKNQTNNDHKSTQNLINITQ